MKKILLFLILFPNILYAGSMKIIGEKGKLNEVNRIIEIKIKKNETIKFVVKNNGDLVHEFNIATKEMHIKHQPEMIKMMEHGILLGNKIDKIKMKEMAKKDHSMAHSHSNSVLLEPGQTGDLIWKFNTNTKIEAACNVPGHYESGMISKIEKISL
jgi:uncharacterized cupredoxin-like copper-binding protein